MCPYCTKMRHCVAATPATREVDWMNGSWHNKNASRQTDAQRFLPLLERKICSGPSLRSFEYSMLIYTEASKLKKWYSDQPYEFHNLSWITEINELFHDILIYWDAPVYHFNFFPIYVCVDLCYKNQVFHLSQIHQDFCSLYLCGHTCHYMEFLRKKT